MQASLEVLACYAHINLDQPQNLFVENLPWDQTLWGNATKVFQFGGKLACVRSRVQTSCTNYSYFEPSFL